jgi:antitoxin component of MazEF toxin-antitoxin module
MKFTKKVIKTSGGLVVRVPADIVKLLNLTEKDYVEIDLEKIDLRLLSRKTK